MKRHTFISDGYYAISGEENFDDQNEDYCGAAIDKLAEYENLEEQGMLAILPCKIGDTVWFIPKYEGKALGMIREDKVQMIGVTTRGIHLKLRGNHDHNKMYMLDKTVFLSREEAEAALNNA